MRVDENPKPTRGLFHFAPKPLISQGARVDEFFPNLPTGPR